MVASKFVRLKVLASVLVLALCLSAAPTRGEQTDNVYLKTLPSTGFVVGMKNDKMVSYGTCWIVDVQKCLVITNQHVMRECEECMVAFPRFENGEVLTASGAYTGHYIHGKVLARDSKRDLALVKLDRMPLDARALELAPSSAAAGTKIWAIGNPGMANKPVNGGTLWRGRSGTVKRAFFMKTTLTGINQQVEACALNTDSGSLPGDSGGPVVDVEGRLVGVNSCSNDQGDYAIDVAEVRLFLQRAMPSDRPQRLPHAAVGSWMVTWKNQGRDNMACLILNADGSAKFVGNQHFAGTYTYSDGVLKLSLPGSGLQTSVQPTWDGSDQFRFTVQYSDGPIEFTLTRR